MSRFYTINSYGYLEPEFTVYIDVPDIVRSFPIGTCWPLAGDIILTACSLGGDVMEEEEEEEEEGDDDDILLLVFIAVFFGSITVFDSAFWE